MSHDNLLGDFTETIWRSTQGATASVGAWFSNLRAANLPSKGKPEPSSPEPSGAQSPSDSAEASSPEHSDVQGLSSEIGTASIPVQDGLRMPYEIEASGPRITPEIELETSAPVTTAPPISPEIELEASPYQLWALVIGINSYSKHPLSGAVADADAIREYLETTLKVPKDHIDHLRDREATRCKIISAFEGLRDNDKIKKDDPILIYYAGHGGKALRQDGEDVIETLIPVDYAPGKVLPIPDRTIASLINGISNKRGNNITVILDCCHSGSGTRGDETVREFVLNPNDVPADLDAGILENPANLATESSALAECHGDGARGLQTAKGFATHGMKSHVLLAACSANEVARESTLGDQTALDDPKEALIVRGRFTIALLELLENVSLNQITYADVLTKIRPIEGQNPQCEGFYSDRFLFDAKVSEPTHKAYQVRSEVRYILQAGKDQGITDGAELTLYRDKKREDLLGVMKAQEGNISTSTTILKPIDKGKLPDAFDNPAIATSEYEVKFEVSYVLQAGRDQGITDGVELTLYRDKKCEDLLGVMKVQEDNISTSTTVLKPVDEGKFLNAFDHPIIAIQTGAGASGDDLAYEVKFEVSYILQAGEAHGITDGAELVLYRDRKREARLAVMKAQDGYISTSTTTLKPVAEGKLPASFGTSAIAVQTRADVSEYKVRLEVSYILQAGRVHGITAGAEFTLYRDKRREAPLVVMKVEESNIETFTTVLKPVDKEKLPGVFDNPVIAFQTRAGASEDLCIHVCLDGQYEHIIKAVEKELSGEDPYKPCRIRRVDEGEATLKIATTGKKFTFIALDNRARKYEFTDMRQFVCPSVENLRAILRGAAHYHFHLNLDKRNNKIQKQVLIEFFELREEKDEDDDPNLIPGDNMLKEGEIEFVVKDGTKYGMKITNNAPWDLYFCCFFFDHADFSIAALTEVGALTPYRKDTSLKIGHSVKIGYEGSSVPPFESDIRKGLNLTIGFLKFYFTSDVIDLSHITQKSPFTKPLDTTRGLKPSERKSNPSVQGTILIPLIQRR